jgi:Tol biopolymer transport system component
METGEHTVVPLPLELGLNIGGAWQKLEFSPNGKKILFGAVHEEENWDIFVADISKLLR